MTIEDLQPAVLDITSENYERIFEIAVDSDGQYFFNLLRKVDFPSDLDPAYYDVHVAGPLDHYSILSWKYYGTVKLWWLVCAVNRLDDPSVPPAAGTILKIIKPEQVPRILAALVDNR